MSDSISKPLNATIKQSIEPNSNILQQDREKQVKDVYTDSVLLVDMENNQKARKKFKIIIGLGVCFMFVGLLMFLLLPPLIHSMIVKTAINMAVLSPDNQKLWAHFPGDSGTIITRNFSFFNFANDERFFLYGQKPKFRQIQGYIITELQDFLNITYNEDMTKVKMKDWLHFDYHPDSRDLEESVSVLNVPSLGYWFTLKNSRDPIVFIEGFSLLFTNIEQSLIDTVLGQGISAQYLPDFQTTYLQLLQPAGISKQNSQFLWEDAAFGFSNKNNLKNWVEAARSSFDEKEKSFSQSALDLKDYFTLSDFQLYFILNQISQYADSLDDLILTNHYCHEIENCDGRELAIRQIASSYVTFNTPPVSSITPTDTICADNQTCQGFYPELNAYYKNVYLIQHPEADPFLTFPIEMVRQWLDYNPSRKQGQYNKNESALFHIGNLDALFNNGTLHDKNKRDHMDATEYLKNIKTRFKLPSDLHTTIFWEWIKYIMSDLIRQKTLRNEKLGIANSFSGGLYAGFSFLQDNLQYHVLKAMLKNRLSQYSCDNLIETSFQTNDQTLIANVCNKYGHNIASDSFIHDSVFTCRNKYGKQWQALKSLGVSILELESFCDKSIKKGFGQIYYNMRKQLNDFYQCDETPNEYCSDYELALKQWVNSTVTLKHPPSAGNLLQSTATFADWNPKAPKIQYYYYATKFTDREFPTFNMTQLYQMFNFDSIYSATSNINTFKNPQTSPQWKDYMRYVVVFISFRGLTYPRTVKELIFGYNDEYLLWRKNNYPPFGGDPSTPSFLAFNDLNITEEQAVLDVEWHTGKDNSTMTAQYYKINNLTYLTTNYTRFNGNQTYWVLESPWAEKDYFYGTSGKNFAPDQENSKNVSIYVPNIQRYGSGSLVQSYPTSRYGYDLNKAYLGEYIYQTGQQFPQNKKYYQNYFAVFNETSVLGFPFFMTKHHFMNCSSNWSSYISVYNYDETIDYNGYTTWDDSYVIVEPFSGASFQSTIFLQANYYFEPDELFTYNQTMLIPIFSIYRSGNLTQEKANQLFGPLTTALNVKTAIFYIGIILALGGTGGFAYGLTNLRRINRRVEEVKNKQSIKISMQPRRKSKKSSISNQNAQNQKLRPLIKDNLEQINDSSNRDSAANISEQRNSQFKSQQ